MCLNSAHIRGITCHETQKEKEKPALASLCCFSQSLIIAIPKIKDPRNFSFRRPLLNCFKKVQILFCECCGPVFFQSSGCIICYAKTNLKHSIIGTCYIWHSICLSAIRCGRNGHFIP